MKKLTELLEYLVTNSGKIFVSAIVLFMTYTILK